MSRLHDLLRRSAARFPAKPAFVSKDGETTYGELDVLTGRFAAALAAFGVRRGDRVAVVLDGHVDYLVAFYGALKAGAVAVPLCPDTRSGPLLRALQHSGARVVVLDSANLRYLDGHAAALPELSLVIARGAERLQRPGHWTEAAFAELCAGPVELHDGGSSRDDLAALVYTSGTTGEPKGVMLPHRALVANTLSIIESLDLGPSDIAGMVLPFYYVFGNSVLHTHLVAGGTIAHLGSLTFLGQFLRDLTARGCTSLSGVPATFARLTSIADPSAFDLSCLRYVAQAGAAMPLPVLEKLRRSLPHTAVYIMYGQTEAAARLACLPPGMLDSKLGSAGRAIPGVTLRIVDPDGAEVPRGQIGEVVAQGDNVMLGYWNDPESTAHVLRPEGLRTRDFGYMDEDGYLFLVGRASELIKSGGHRISPVEIEAAILQLEDIAECAVAGIPDESLGETIAAFVVPKPGAVLTKRRILDACFQALPRFKMPSILRQVEDLPRTPSGKIQRAVLRDWHAEGRGTEIT